MFYSHDKFRPKAQCFANGRSLLSPDEYFKRVKCWVSNIREVKWKLVIVEWGLMQFAQDLKCDSILSGNFFFLALFSSPSLSIVYQNYPIFFSSFTPSSFEPKPTSTKTHNITNHIYLSQYFLSPPMVFNTGRYVSYRSVDTLHQYFGEMENCVCIGWFRYALVRFSDSLTES